jgi:hypothetical protein
VGVSYDPDALDYFARAEALGGSFDLTGINATYTEPYIKAAFNRLILGLKADSVWNSLTELYMLSGVSFGGLMAKLKYSSVATLTNVGPFVTGDYVAVGSGAGLKGNGTTKYLNTNFNDSAIDGTGDNRAFSTYLTQVVGSAQSLIGSLNSPLAFQLVESLSSAAAFDLPVNDARINTGSNASNYRIGSRRGVNDTEAYINGVSVGVDTSTTTRLSTGNNWYIFGNTSTASSSARIAAAHIGTGLTDTQAANLSLRVNAFMTSIGANVY